MDAYDRWKTSPPEPATVGKCTYCDADLYAGCEYVFDQTEGDRYCGDECYVGHKRAAGDLVTKIGGDSY